MPGEETGRSGAPPSARFCPLKRGGATFFSWLQTWDILLPRRRKKKAKRPRQIRQLKRGSRSPRSFGRNGPRQPRVKQRPAHRARAPAAPSGAPARKPLLGPASPAAPLYGGPTGHAASPAPGVQTGAAPPPTGKGLLRPAGREEEPGWPGSHGDALGARGTSDAWARTLPAGLPIPRERPFRPSPPVDPKPLRASPLQPGAPQPSRALRGFGPRCPPKPPRWPRALRGELPSQPLPGPATNPPPQFAETGASPAPRATSPRPLRGAARRGFSERRSRPGWAATGSRLARRSSRCAALSLAGWGEAWIGDARGGLSLYGPAPSKGRGALRPVKGPPGWVFPCRLAKH